jgi:3-phosphoshikimate 1-carboxyvinyltransferase
VHPLRSRGAIIDGKAHATKAGDVTAPLQITGLGSGTRLSALEYQLPVASAQVKSALLLSGLLASGPTVVSEPCVSRDHTERMLAALGIPLRTAGTVVELHPPADPLAIAPFDVDLPGDLSAAAFMLVAGAIIPGSRVTTRGTGLNPTRSGIIDVLRLLGADIGIQTTGNALNEPVGEVSVAASALRSGLIAGELSVRSIDEIPIAAALAARARGKTEFADVGELRVKESDRVATIVDLLRSFGLDTEESAEGFTVIGKPEGKLKACTIHSRGDHRVAMTGAVLGLLGDGVTVIEDADCIATSFPRFVGTLRALGAHVEVEEAR